MGRGVESLAGLMRQGAAALGEGRVEEAARLYRQATEAGNDASAYSKLAMALSLLGRFGESVEAARHAVRLRPESPELHSNLGNALQMDGQVEGAVESYERALQLRPDYPEAKVNLGHALTTLGSFDRAIVMLQGVLTAQPKSLPALINLGNALQARGDLDGAIDRFRRAIELYPDSADAHANLALALKDAALLDGALEHTRRSLALRPDAKVADSLLILIQYHPAFDGAAIARAQREWFEQYIKGRVQPRLAHANEPVPNRRLRVGYVSPDFRRHPVGYNVLPLLEQHDHGGFEVFCYSNVARADDFTQRFRGWADHWRDIRTMNDEEAADRIREDRIDILVDLALHTGENRLGVFARKPAPLQVSFAGYPGTTGLPTIDYRLTDSLIDPVQHSIATEFEKPVRLQSSFWCYQPLGDEPQVNALPAASNGYVTFGCLNNFCKVNDAVLAIWGRVLATVPDARLLLLSKSGSHRERTRWVLQASGVDPGRVEFVEPGPRPDYLKLFHRIDASLDTFPYNGHTTGLDSLWMGVPLVTLIGDGPLSRSGWSYMCHLDIEYLAAENHDRFVEIARALAGDLPRLAEMRSTLRERMRRSVLCDSAGFARQIELAFRGMWTEWCVSEDRTPSSGRQPARSASMGQALNAAIARHRSGNLLEAEAHYRRILAESPGDPDALHLLGVVCHQTGRSEEATKLIADAIAVKPDNADFHSNLGLALLATGRIDQSIAAHEKAVALKPEYAVAHCNLGLALLASGRTSEAFARFRTAIGLKSDYPEAHYNLGRALQETGDLKQSILSLRQAISLRADYVEALVQLGNVMVEQGELTEGLRCFREAQSLRPDSVEIEYNVASALTELGRIDEAVTVYRRVIARRPDYADAHLNLGKAYKERGEWDQAIACYRRAASLAPGARIEQNLITSYQYLPEASPEEIVGEHLKWNEKYARPLRGPDRHREGRHSLERRLRIGYVSPDFRRHPVGFCLLPVLSGHDPTAVEVYCYSDTPLVDEQTRRIRDRAHVWRETRKLSDEQLAERVREDQIDILVDLANHTKGSRLLTFARKRAAVQVTWLGWPGTTGLDAIDYRLSDPYLDPPGSPLEAMYPEQVVRTLDSFWSYGRPEVEVPVNDVASICGPVTFGALNAVFKTNDAVFEAWARILTAVGGSKLVMRAPLGETRRRIVGKFAGLGIDPERVEFVGRLDYREFWKLYHRIHVVLDTFPYNGHTTSLDALWMGVPVVSLVGLLPVGRAGLSILSNLGLGEFAVTTRETYVERAVGLATDFGRLRHLRSTLRQTLEASPIMDGSGFARKLESAYRSMWRELRA